MANCQVISNKVKMIPEEPSFLLEFFLIFLNFCLVNILDRRDKNLSDNLLNITKEELMDLQWTKYSILESFHDCSEVTRITNVWCRWALMNLFMRIIKREILNCFVENPGRPKMRAVIGVVSSIWMINDPLRIIGCMVQNNINNAE